MALSSFIPPYRFTSQTCYRQHCVYSFHKSYARGYYYTTPLVCMHTCDRDRDRNCNAAAPSRSKQPSRMSQKQQAMPAAREAQRVMAITPLFWEKVVLGGPPARAEKKHSHECPPSTIHCPFPLQLWRPRGKSSGRPGSCSPRRQAGRPGCGSRHLGPRWAGR